MLILQVKEGEMIQVGNAKVAFIKRGPKNRNQIRLAFEADKEVKILRLKTYLTKEHQDNADRPKKNHARRPAKKDFRKQNTSVPFQPRTIPVFKKRS